MSKVASKKTRIEREVDITNAMFEKLTIKLHKSSSQKHTSEKSSVTFNLKNIMYLLEHTSVKFRMALLINVAWNALVAFPPNGASVSLNIYSNDYEDYLAGVEIVL